MKKLGFLLLAAIGATSAFAGEVGAQDPQFARTSFTNMVVAIADTGVSTRWTSTPTDREASTAQIAQLQELNRKIDVQISENLEKRIAEKMELSLTN